MKRIVSFVCLILLFLSIATPVFAADADVVINEFQVEPSGSSQWVEVFNKGNDTVDMTGWIIDDSGGSDSFTISSGSLGPHQCFSFQSSAFHLNTASSDTVQLLHNGTVIDSHVYDRSPGANMSIGRAPDGQSTWITFSVPTRDGLNADGTSCATPTPTPSPTMTTVPTPTKVPTPSRTPTPEKSPTPTKVPTPAKSASLAVTSAGTTKSAVLGSSASRPTPTPDYHVPTAVIVREGQQTTVRPTQPIANEVKTLGASGFNPSIIVVIFGILLLLGSGGYGYYLYRKNH